MRIQYKCHESFKHLQDVYVCHHVQINVYSQQTRNLIPLHTVLVFSLLEKLVLVLARNIMGTGDGHDS